MEDEINENRQTVLDAGIETCISKIEAGKGTKRTPIRSFLDLEVYQNSYKASIIVDSLLESLPRYL